MRVQTMSGFKSVGALGAVMSVAVALAIGFATAIDITATSDPTDLNPPMV